MVIRLIRFILQIAFPQTLLDFSFYRVMIHYFLIFLLIVAQNDGYFAQDDIKRKKTPLGKMSKGVFKIYFYFSGKTIRVIKTFFSCEKLTIPPCCFTMDKTLIVPVPPSFFCETGIEFSSNIVFLNTLF